MTKVNDDGHKQLGKEEKSSSWFPKLPLTRRWSRLRVASVNAHPHNFVQME